jgi:DNA processing protein
VRVLPRPLPRAELTARLGLLATPRMRRREMLALLTECGSGERALREVRGTNADDVVHARVQRALQLIDRFRITVIPHDEDAYPPLLRARLDDERPPLLFALGSIELLHDDRCVAVVGSRSATAYGIDVADDIGSELARADVCVVSGMARGIDAAAHTSALRDGGRTIAVLGCGVDVCYPREHRRLYDRIARDGLLLSEWLPGEEPRRYHFPDRNRVIAALSRAVIVVEATQQSGALKTAEHAAKMNVDVFCVPNAIYEPSFAGVLQLVREGAALFTGVGDALRAVDLLPLGAMLDDENGASEEAQPLDPLQARLWCALGRRSLDVDDLFDRAGVPRAAGASALLALELDGRIARLPGNTVRRIPQRRRRNRADDGG